MASSQPTENQGEEIASSNQSLSTITSQINATIGEAAGIAGKIVGPDVYPIAVILGTENRSLVYDIWLIDSEINNLYKVKIDAGEGKVLSSQQEQVTVPPGLSITDGNNVTLALGNSTEYEWPWPINCLLRGCPQPFGY